MGVLRTIVFQQFLILSGLLKDFAPHGQAITARQFSDSRKYGLNRLNDFSERLCRYLLNMGRQVPELEHLKFDRRFLEQS